jgi:hypothetical protein
MKYYGIQNEVKAYINRLQAENGINVSPSTVKTINDRVESLKRSGDWSRFSLGFNDTDGDAYLARAGVTDPLGRCEVLWFTRGVKSLNLWKDMVCWSLRNYQNIGTGSTVYSLGGLGTYNGTAQNSPTWGANGINFSNTTQLITLGTIPAFTYSLLTVISPTSSITSATAVQAPIGVRTFGGILLGSATSGLTNELITRYVAPGDTNPSTTQAGGYTGSGTISANTFNYISTSVSNSGNLLINRNGSNLSVTNNTGWLPNLSVAYYLGDRLNNDASFIGNMPFSALINTEGSVSQQVNLYNLYKSTLGSNLGLP